MIRVSSSLALKGVLEKLRGDFEQAVGALELRFDATQAILAQLAQGERPDLLVLTEDALEDLRAHGRVGAVRLLGTSGVGLAVRAGARKPDIGSVDAFIHALVNAESVAQSKVGASGLYFSEVLGKLNIEGRLRRRVIVEKGPVGLVVARGEAELGVQQLCELAPVPGIDIVGPLPASLQKLTRFAAAVTAGAAHPEGAAALIGLLLSPPSRAAMLAGGMTPA